jgi:hypothetical protein
MAIPLGPGDRRFMHSGRRPHQIGRRGVYQGTMRVKFGPTLAVFRGEAKLAYDHAVRRCTIEGRGIDGPGASRANVSGAVEASGGGTTLLKVEGHFNVSGPLETFANAGGAHLGCGSDYRRHNHAGMLRKSRTFVPQY